MAKERIVFFEDEEGEGIAFPKHNYLMIIGINTYKDRHIPSLSNARRDAQQVAALLTKCYGFDTDNQVILYDEEASLKNITFHLRELTKKVKATDSLLIYFAGHGYLDRTTDIAYLIPSDAKKGEVDTYLPNSTVLEFIKAIKSLHTFLVLDSCFSGTLLRKRNFDDSEALADNMEKYPSRIVLAAGSIEAVSDGSYNDNSPFAKAFMKRLENNTQKKLPASEVIQFVKKAVPGNARQQPCSGTLYETGDLQGEFIFYRTNGQSILAKPLIENIESEKTENRETTTDKNFVEKITHFFQNNKITGSIILIAILIIGIGGVIEGIKNMQELGQTAKHDTVFVKNIADAEKPSSSKKDSSQNSMITEAEKKLSPAVKETKLPSTEKGKQSLSPTPPQIVNTPTEKPAQAKEELSYYEVTLSVNAPFSKAEILVDGKAAEILNNTLTIKKIRISGGKHTITLKANGKVCEQSQVIHENKNIILSC